jgi:hypothetical protein
MARRTEARWPQTPNRESNVQRVAESLTHDRSSLLDAILDAHGGLDRFNRIQRIDITVNASGNVVGGKLDIAYTSWRLSLTPVESPSGML